MVKSRIDIDNFAKKWIKELSKDFSLDSFLSDIRKEHALKSIGKYRHRNILEIGCGLNPLFPYVDSYEKYTIVEPGKEFIGLVRRFDKYNDNVIILNGFLEDVCNQLRDNSFDFIFLSSVLHYSPNPDEILRILYDLCGKVTVVHINVPNAHSFHRLLALEMGYIDTIFDKSEANVEQQVNWVFDKAKLYEITQDNGFEILEFGTYFIKPFTNRQMEEIITCGILSEDIIAGLGYMVKYIPDLGCEMFVDLRIKEDKPYN